MATATNLSVNLVDALLAILKASCQTGLKLTDPTRLNLIEIGPRSEEFADAGLSCFICPNDPEDPDGWADEEITEPGKKYNTTASTTMIESGGGQFFNLRFTIIFVLFYNELGISRQEAFVASRVMLDRIQRAIFDAGLSEGETFGKLFRGDKSKFHLFHASRAVKKRRLTPSGSETETFYRGKMWLQFEAYMEA